MLIRYFYGQFYLTFLARIFRISVFISQGGEVQDDHYEQQEMHVHLISLTLDV